MPSDTNFSSPAPSWWPQLVQVPQRMAAEVGEWLPKATREGYCRFLDAMFHYTRDSEARLRHAAASTQDTLLRAFFLELADDEAPHFRLAERDLASFEKAPGDAPPAAVQRFKRVWDALGTESSAGHLGALFALESVASHLASGARSALARLKLGPSNAAFVSVHLQADEVHGRQCTEHCQRVGVTQSDALLGAAQAAADAWVDMHRCLREP